MRNRRACVTLIATALFYVFGIATAAEPLVSGPQAGSKLPGGFSPVNVTNAELPDYAGKRNDYTEQHGASPVVLVFGRGIAVSTAARSPALLMPSSRARASAGWGASFSSASCWLTGRNQ